MARVAGLGGSVASRSRCSAGSPGRTGSRGARPALADGPLATRASAICTALSAAPLRRLSPLTNRASAWSSPSARPGCGRPARDRSPRPGAGWASRPARPPVPGRGARSPRSGPSAESNSATMACECPVNTGTRTQVQVTERSGSPRIFRLSSRNFCSSLVSPRAVLHQVAGDRQHVVGDGVGEDGRPAGTSTARPSKVRATPPRPPSSSAGSRARPPRPARRPTPPGRSRRSAGRSPAASWSGLSTGIATMVVQFGLATIPFGIEPRASSLTSGTTRGTSGSIRHAEELSMTIAPAAAKRGASSREPGAPQENRARSRPAGSAAAASSTDQLLAAGRRAGGRPSATEANTRSSSSGKSRSSRTARITPSRPARSRRPLRLACRSVYERAAHRRRPRPSDRASPGSPAQDSSKASCRARTASSTAAARIMQEIRIDEVEIISMLMPCGGQRLEGQGGDPGMRLHAGPDERDPGHVGVAVDPGRPELGDESLADLGADRRGRRRGR